MYDAVLIKKLLDKPLYTRLFPYIKEHSVSKESWKIIQALGKYYRSYPDSATVNLDEFKRFFFLLHTKDLKETSHTIYEHIFVKVADEDVSSIVVEDVLKNYITKDYATQIMNKALDVVHDKEESTLDDISNMVHQYNREIGRTITKDDLFASTDLSYIRKAVGSDGFSWRLNELNISLGPIRQGDFIIIAARPETGKTTMVACEVSNFIGQLTDDRPIIWVNNEESSDKVMYRIVQSYFGVTNSEIDADIAHHEDVFKSMAGGRVLVTNDDKGMNDVKRLSALFDEYNPCLIVFDQLDKVNGFSRMEREDLRIGKLYEWARELAKKYGPVIAVSQVDGSGEGQQWINMAQLRGSKTDKIGEADAIVTIGKGESEYTRYIHIPKNKLYGGKKSMEEHRHGKFEVTIIPEIARYQGVY